MGLSAQVAFSSLLAFFPAVVFLVGLLDLVGAYDALQEFLAPVAPGDVLETIDTLQKERRRHVGRRVRRRRRRRRLGGERRHDRGDQGRQPRLRPRRDAAVLADADIALVLVVLTGLVLAGLLLLIVFGGPLGTAIADKARPRRRVRAGLGVLRWPIAFVAILLFFALVYYLAPNVEVRSWKWLDARLARRQPLVARALGPLRPLHELLGLVLEDVRRARSGIVLLLWLNYSAFALLFGAELNSSSTAGRDPRRGRRERRARQAEPAGLGDLDRALDLRGAAVGEEAEGPGGELHLPRERAGGRETRLAVDALADQVGVVQLRAVADGDRVGTGLDPRSALPAALRSVIVPWARQSSFVFFAAGAGGRRWGGGRRRRRVADAKEPNIRVVCGSRWNR